MSGRGHGNRDARPLVTGVVALLMIAACGSTAPSAAPTWSTTASASPPPATTPVALRSSAPSPSPSFGPSPITFTATGVANVSAAAVPPALLTVAFGDGRHGWAGGDGVLLGTRDGGATWSREWAGAASVFRVTALDAGHAWALISATPATRNGAVADRLLRTVDAGQRWLSLPLRLPVRSVAFATPDRGWAVLGPFSTSGYRSGTLYATRDGGATWHPTLLVAPVDDTCPDTSGVVWAASGSGVYHSTAGGGWVKVHAGPNNATNSGYAASLRCDGATVWVLWVGGAGLGNQAYLVDRTLDGGAHWKSVLGNQYFPMPAGVAFIDAYSGPFAAAGGTAAGFIGFCPACGVGSWSYTRTSDGGRTVARAPLAGLDGTALNDIAFADREHGWIAGTGAGGFLLATSDGGVSWHRAYPSSALRPALDVAFVSASIGFGLGVVGAGRVVLRTDDGGQTWAVVGRLPADPASAAMGPLLAFVGPERGWAATTAAIVTTVDGGHTWRVVPGAMPGGVAFANALDGCSGGLGANEAAATTDGGASWQTADASNGLPVCAASLTDPRWQTVARPFSPNSSLFLGSILDGSHAWAYGVLDADSAIGLAETSDGGATWTAYHWPVPGQPELLTPYSIARVSFVTPLDGWVFTTFGRIYATTDGGASWLGVGP